MNIALLLCLALLFGGLDPLDDGEDVALRVRRETGGAEGDLMECGLTAGLITGNDGVTLLDGAGLKVAQGHSEEAADLTQGVELRVPDFAGAQLTERGQADVDGVADLMQSVRPVVGMTDGIEEDVDLL